TGWARMLRVWAVLMSARSRLGSVAVIPSAKVLTRLTGHSSASRPGPFLVGLLNPRKFFTMLTALLTALRNRANLLVIPLIKLSSRFLPQLKAFLPNDLKWLVTLSLISLALLITDLAKDAQREMIEPNTDLTIP